MNILQNRPYPGLSIPPRGRHGSQDLSQPTPACCSLALYLEATYLELKW